MKLVDKNEFLLKKIAAVVSRNPRLTMYEIAEQINISKATLYRTFGTREEIDNILNQQIDEELEAITNYIDSIVESSIDTNIDSYRYNIKNIIITHFKYDDFFYTLPLIYKFRDSECWPKYQKSLNSFFLKGQKSGIISLEFNYEFLTISFTSIIFATMSSEKTLNLYINHKIDSVSNLICNAMFIKN